jgi:hypothetical protein
MTHEFPNARNRTRRDYAQASRISAEAVGQADRTDGVVASLTCSKASSPTSAAAAHDAEIRPDQIRRD